MKVLKSLIKNILKPSEPEIVEFIATPEGWKKLPHPIMSNDIKCLTCDGSECYTPLSNPPADMRRVWMCANPLCSSLDDKKFGMATIIPPTSRRALLFNVWCQNNGIGDTNHDVRFEDIKQSDGKIKYLLKFAEKPNGLILMNGNSGLGKTYAALATCELFTRRNTSCVFMTQRVMAEKLLETFKSERLTNFKEKVSTTELLVIDDFGTAEPTPAFMSFFLDLIDSRLQWTNRGTIITTNLTMAKLGDYCGEALIDRMITGQRFEFIGKTRRIEQTL